MRQINLITRRGFIDRNFKLGLGIALSTLTDIPLVVRRALAENNIGISGKKVLFIFLRGANDALNSVIPVADSAMYDQALGTKLIRPNIGINLEGGSADYYTGANASTLDFPASGTVNDTFFYSNAIRSGNGFAALHPSLKFLSPVLGAGDLAILHRVGYPKQSRSHFDSQRYWENGDPNNNALQEGIFYRAMVESGLANKNALTGVSFQSALPLILRGDAAAMTNLSDPLRYNLLGIPYTAGEGKADAALKAANAYPFPAKTQRDLLALQYQNLTKTLEIFGGIDFNETVEQLVDDPDTDGDTGQAYRLFPTSNSTNGRGSPNKYVVDTGAYGFFKNLRAAALVLNKTDAIVAGTEVGGWDTHNNQGSASGTHANLLRRVGWAMYALQKYFTRYGRGANAPSGTKKVNWDDVVVVTLSEFGRTTVENGSGGTDHAEASCMFVAGGAVNGGIYGCHSNDSVPWITGPANQALGVDGSMFGVSDRYLKRAIDYRSVLGKIIRDHLGASPTQLGNIIPGYANPAENLEATSATTGLDGTPIMGEPAFL